MTITQEGKSCLDVQTMTMKELDEDHDTADTEESSSVISDMELTISDMDYGFEIQQMSADADAILESIRSEASTPSPRPKRKKKKIIITTTTASTTPDDHHDEDEASLVTYKNTDHEEEDDDLTINTYNTDINSLLAEEHAVRISAELVAELSAAETEFNAAQRDINSLLSREEHDYAVGKSAGGLMVDLGAVKNEMNAADPKETLHCSQTDKEEATFTRVDQEMIVLTFLVWSLVFVLLGQFLGGGGRLLDEDGLMTFPSLINSLPV